MLLLEYNENLVNTSVSLIVLSQNIHNSCQLTPMNMLLPIMSHLKKFYNLKFIELKAKL